MIDYHVKKRTNDDSRRSDCTRCMRVVDGMCVINGCKPKPIWQLQKERTHCQYWWESQGEVSKQVFPAEWPEMICPYCGSRIGGK